MIWNSDLSQVGEEEIAEIQVPEIVPPENPTQRSNPLFAAQEKVSEMPNLLMPLWLGVVHALTITQVNITLGWKTVN